MSPPGKGEISERIREDSESEVHMKQCCECNATISRMARTCPHCGRPQYLTRVMLALLELAIIGILFSGFLWRIGLLRLEW